MHRSQERILSSHTGSLPRSEALRDMMYQVQEGTLAEEDIWGSVVDEVQDVIGRQKSIGLDLINDGEVGKPGFLNYVSARLDGLGGEADSWSFKDLDESPDLLKVKLEQYEGAAAQHINMPACVGEIKYHGGEAAKRDIDLLKAAVGGDESRAFMTAPSPGCLAIHITNHHYRNYEELLGALADAMAIEYKLIADAGLTLQLDCPDLPSAHPGHGKFWMTDVVEEMGYQAWAELQLEAIASATEGIPGDQMRLHLCWSNYKGPHHYDAPLREVLEPVLRVGRPNTISFEGGNPRHVHEWKTFEELRLPDEKVIMPGVIDTLTNFVEHPEAVAQRIERYASVVGRERVIAGTDCGFGTFVGFGEVVPSVAWRKLHSLCEGAELASARLWS
jgi:5-methyltetrahydropteroyltriglutamate--homocysteine methyltransferase